MAEKTVKQLAVISGVSVRTLHHYDAIGLLTPAYVGENGYRYYAREQQFRLQQILFYRDLGMGLGQIARTLDDPDFDPEQALLSHRKRIEIEIERHTQLIHTIETTLKELYGAKNMSKETPQTNPLNESNPFEGFSPERQAAYEKELVDRYGKQAQDKIAESKKNLSKVSKAQMASVKAEGHQINLELVKRIELGDTPAANVVQALVARQHAWVSTFWVPNRSAYIALGQSYCDSADFRAFYDNYDSRLVEFLAQAMKIYAQQKLD